MKLYKCAECEKEKVKARFYAGTLDNAPEWWTCKQCHIAYVKYMNSYEGRMMNEEIARQMAKDD